MRKPEGIWYTPVTGIWQTVWMEPVSEKHIADLRTTPNIDKNQVSVDDAVCGGGRGDVIEIRVIENGDVMTTARADASQTVDVDIDSPKLWSPESPFLYDMEVVLYSDGEEVDKVDSYFAMRKVSIERDEKGIVRPNTPFIRI